MQQRPGKLPPPTAAERRSGQDRRRVDQGAAANGRDRRVGMEPRRPEVVELALTPSEWGALHDALPSPAADPQADARPDPRSAPPAR